MFGPAFAKGVPVFLGGFFVPTGTLRKKEECMPRPMHGWSHYAWIAKDMGKNQAQVKNTLVSEAGVERRDNFRTACRPERIGIGHVAAKFARTKHGHQVEHGIVSKCA